MPLEDPDYLKGLRKQQDDANETATQIRMNMIAQMEANYAASHADLGYACTLGTLYPKAAGEERSAAAAKEESNGYRFTLSGCSGKPAAKYRLTAVAIDPESEMKTFCVNESGTLKSVATAESKSCFGQGKVLTDVTPSGHEPDPQD